MKHFIITLMVATLFVAPAMAQPGIWTPTFTVTKTPTQTPTVTNTPTNTPTQTPTETEDPNDPWTPTPTATNTPANTATRTITPTWTRPPVPGIDTPTPTQTATITNTPANTATPTSTPTVTNTPTSTPTSTPTDTPVDTATPTVTNTPVDTATSTPTGTPTNTPTVTPTPTQTREPQWLVGAYKDCGEGEPPCVVGTSFNVNKGDQISVITETGTASVKGYCYPNTFLGGFFYTTEFTMDGAMTDGECDNDPNCIHEATKYCYRLDYSLESCTNCEVTIYRVRK